MKKLILTVGLPRSGKSTWARKQGHPIVNPDSIRLALYGQPFIEETESMVWVIARYMVRALFLAGHDIVILDATNITRERRDFWESEDWNCSNYYFKTSIRACIERAVKDNREDLIPIIKKMAKEKN